MVVFLNNRHYLPGMAVFLSVDPIVSVQNPASLNAYVYARANPISMQDRSGLDPGWEHDNNPCNGGGSGGYYDPETCVDTADGGQVPTRLGPRGRAEYERDPYSVPCRFRPSCRGMDDALDHTADEIYTNTHSTITEQIDDVFGPSGLRLAVWLVPGMQQKDVTEAMLMLGLFANKLKGGGDWDIKHDFEFEYYDIVVGGTVYSVRRDVFGNMHYGAVLNAAGFDASTATAIAGVGESFPPLQPIFGANSEADDAATVAGYGVDFSSPEAARTSVEQALVTNLDEMVAASQASGDNAVICRTGCG